MICALGASAARALQWRRGRGPSPRGAPDRIEEIARLRKVKVVTIDNSWETIQPYLDNPRFLRDLRSYLAHFIQTDQTPDDEMTRPDAGQLASPLIRICGDYVVCDGHRLDLARKPKALALFRAFLEAPEMFLSSDKLLESLYGAGVWRKRSRRYRGSCHESMVKLLSRARIAATRAFGGPKELGLEWIAFNPSLKGWHLYRLSHPYPRQPERLAAAKLDGSAEVRP